jgi:PAS domain S-box-containing protein
MDATGNATPWPLVDAKEDVLDSLDGVVIVDATGIIRATNHQANVMFGYAPAELVGKSIAVLIPGDRSRGAAQRRQRILHRLVAHVGRERQRSIDVCCSP